MSDFFPSRGSVVSFGGSRALRDALFVTLLDAVVHSVCYCDAAISVGCAAGADALVISSALALAAGSLTVFAVGDSDGRGFWSGSAPLSLLRSVAPCGGKVAWWAGGPPSIPLRARLLRRSVAALRDASCFVIFLASPSSHGSLRVAAEAARSDIAVFAFACYLPSSAPAPLAGCAGAWLAAKFCGFSCWRWSPSGDFGFAVSRLLEV